MAFPIPKFHTYIGCTYYYMITCISYAFEWNVFCINIMEEETTIQNQISTKYQKRGKTQPLKTIKIPSIN